MATTSRLTADDLAELPAADVRHELAAATAAASSSWASSSSRPCPVTPSPSDEAAAVQQQVRLP